MNDEKLKEVIETKSVAGALFSLALPTVIGQIILVFYNMADTFFVGMTGNDAMLAAVTVCMPGFMFLSAISNLFGIGGASVMSRAMGRQDVKRVKAASAFAFWGCLAVTALYSVLVLVGKDAFIDLLGGTNPEVHKNAVEYLMTTVALGGGATAMGTLFSHLVRAEGRATHAGVGIALGGILNIALDPLFMFVILPRGREALGAAVATLTSNVVTLIYFCVVIIRIRNKSSLSFKPSAAMLKDGVPRDIFASGLPACVMTLFENISYAVLDKLMSLEGLAMQAGIGVAKKINMLAHCTVRGIAQGALPLIGYTFASGKWDRMKKTVKTAHLAAVGVAALCMIANLFFAPQLTGLFIHQESPSLQAGIVFLRILCVGGPFSASAYTYISFFQATGEGKRSFLLAILRKGLVDIPLMFLLRVIWPVYGIVSATPLADALCCLVANLMFARFMKTHTAQDRLTPAAQEKMEAAD